MTVHHARVIALAAVLVGITAFVPLAACNGPQETPDEQHALAEQAEARPEAEILSLRALPEQGNAVSQLALGLMYADDRYVPQDGAEAVRWYRLAADQGHALAQGSLVAMYWNGRGVPQDNIEAHMWLNLAAAQFSAGDRRDWYVTRRDAVAEPMTADQIADAQRRAREWTPTPEP